MVSLLVRELLRTGEGDQPVLAEPLASIIGAGAQLESWTSASMSSGEEGAMILAALEPAGTDEAVAISVTPIGTLLVSREARDDVRAMMGGAVSRWFDRATADGKTGTLIHADADGEPVAATVSEGSVVSSTGIASPAPTDWEGLKLAIGW
jgi:hypothetical protein